MKRYKIVAGFLLPGMTMTFAGTICLFIPIGDQVFLFVLVSIGVAATLIGMVMWCSSSGHEELVFEGSVSVKVRDGRTTSTGDMSDLLLPQKQEAKIGSSLGTNSDPSIRSPSYYCQASRPIQFGVSWTRPKPEPEPEPEPEPKPELEQISPSSTQARVPVLPPALQNTSKAAPAPILRTTVPTTSKPELSPGLRSPTPVQNTTPKPAMPISAPSLSPSGFSTEAWVTKPVSVSSPQLGERNEKTKSPIPVLLHTGELPIRNPETAV